MEGRKSHEPMFFGIVVKGFPGFPQIQNSG